MEKAMYPSPYIRITQKHGIGTHVDSYAFDEAGSDGGIDYLIASFTGTIKKIYTFFLIAIDSCIKFRIIIMTL